MLRTIFFVIFYFQQNQKISASKRILVNRIQVTEDTHNTETIKRVGLYLETINLLKVII